MARSVLFIDITNTNDDDQVKQITDFIRSHVAAVKLEQNTQQELSFILPDNSVKRGGFEMFFSDLEKRKTELGIASFGLADTTLEEVTATQSIVGSLLKHFTFLSFFLYYATNK